MRVLMATALAMVLFCMAGAGADESKPSPAPETPSKINEKFLDPEIEPAEWVERWESESREIFVARREIVDAVRLVPGMRVADVGAGTGLFVEPFANAVGAKGKVYALDISPKFVEFIADRADESGLTQVEARLSTTDSTELAAESVDVVFLCDTYHHFEHPQKMLRSIHRALRPGGRLVVVDFERIEGVSRAWILGHVRAGKKAVIKEITAAGFRLADEVKIDELRENYCLRFSKQPGTNSPQPDESD